MWKFNSPWLFALICLLFLSFFVLSNTELASSFMNNEPEQSYSNTKQAGIAVLGDSLSDEYRADDNRGGDFSDHTYNWVELLSKYRKVNFGPWGNSAEPRRAGYAYNWALTGETTESMLLSGQHTGVAQQVNAGEVRAVIIYIGANDFAPYNYEGYQAIYNNEFSQTQLDEKSNNINDSITKAIDTVQQAGEVKILLLKIPNWNNHLQIQQAFPDKEGRQRVSDTINKTNQQLELLAKQNKIAIADPNAAYSKYVKDPTAESLQVGSIKLVRTIPSDNPLHEFLGDKTHPGTVLNLILANYLIEHLNKEFNLELQPFTDQEMKNIVEI